MRKLAKSDNCAMNSATAQRIFNGVLCVLYIYFINSHNVPLSAVYETLFVFLISGTVSKGRH